MNNEDKGKLFDYSLKLLSIRPRTVAEIRIRLLQYSHKHQLEEKLTVVVINELLEKRFLNDAEFAAWFIGQRRDFNPKGRRFLEMELLNKGLDREVIREALKGNGDVDELESARRLILKKSRIWHNLTPDSRRKKIFSLLQSRGFNWEIISKVIDSYRKKE